MRPNRTLWTLAFLCWALAACAPSPGDEVVPDTRPAFTQAAPATAAPAPSEAPSRPTQAPIKTEESSLAIPPAPTGVFDQDGLAIGPGRGFVVLDDPLMVAAGQADWLEPDSLVLGVVQEGEAQAFPIAQMAYHHIANTTIGGEPYLVTY